MERGRYTQCEDSSCLGIFLNGSLRLERGAVVSTEKRSFSVVGNSVPRVDGADKVTGRAKYVADLIIPGMIEGKFLRSPYAHARIRSINTTEAEAMPDVVAVL